MILIENVPGLLGIRGQSEYRELCDMLTSRGYQVKARVLDAANYGIAQQRTRAFVVAWVPSRAAEFQFPQATHHSGSAATVREAFRGLPEPPLDHTEHPSFANHVRVRISAINQLRISHVRPGGGRTDIPVDLQLPCHSKDNGHRHLDVYGRLRWDRPSGTITAMFDNFTRGRFAHPEVNRSITAREGARLQSFPDEFRFVGPKKEVARQIGNAVPPRMGLVLASSLINALEKRSIQNEQAVLPLSFRVG
jgi:DNA (cytosine-5)-methyltransferase 1